MDKQEAFNKSAHHLLGTRRPSISSSGVCSYRGSGCALRPFIREGLERQADEMGPCEDLADSVLVPECLELRCFLEELQACHDEPQLYVSAKEHLSSESWFADWRNAMIRLAARHGLDHSILG